jgi:phosphatidate cytidylyltransferase
MLTALFAGSASIAVIIWSHYGLMLFCAIVSLAGVWEFLSMQGRGLPTKALAIAAGVAVWAITLLAKPVYPDKWMVFVLGIGLLLLPAVAILTLYDTKETAAAQTVGSVVLAMVYCFVPIYLLYDIALSRGYMQYDALAGSRFNETYEYRIALFVLLLTWVLDSAAYFGGRFFGKNPLFPRISPKKTWEGAVIGALTCVGLGAVMLHYNVAGVNWLGVASIIAIVSQLGDLVESMFKRNAHIKDSGSLLPGHGGILDRFDGVYLSMPIVYLYVLLGVG